MESGALIAKIAQFFFTSLTDFGRRRGRSSAPGDPGALLQADRPSTWDEKG